MFANKGIEEHNKKKELLMLQIQNKELDIKLLKIQLELKKTK